MNEGFERGNQGGRLEWLFEPQDACKFRRDLRAAISGRKDERDFAFAQRSRNRVYVLAAEIDIEHGAIDRSIIADDFQSLVDRCGGPEHLGVLVMQNLPQIVGQEILVLDDQDSPSGKRVFAHGHLDLTLMGRS